MDKMRLLVGGVCLIVNCAPAFSQGTNQSATDSNFKGLQNLVNGVNNGQANPGAGVPGGPGGRHRWKGGAGGNGAGPTGTNGSASGSSIGAGAGPTGSGVDAIGRGKNMDPAKVAERRAKILKRFDTNGDGVLDDAEKAKWQAFRAERRAQREAQMNGGGPGGPNAGAGGPGANGPGGAGFGGHHRHRNMQNGGAAGLPGAHGGGPGDFPSGFPGGGNNGSAPSTTSTNP